MIGIDTTKKFKYIWFVLFYITFIFIAIFYSYQLFSNIASGQASWQDMASYDFKLVDQTFEDGVLTNTYGISTPEQLAGAFMISESTEKNLNNSSLVYADTIGNIGEPDEVEIINSEYVLLNDVNMSKREWVPSTFSGVFNGNYHVISNLQIESSSYQYLGMVTELRSTTVSNNVATNGIIKNLFLKNITVVNSYTSSVATYTGAVAGYCRGQIQNVVVLSGSVTGSAYKGNYDRCAGGIAGNLESYSSSISANITNCVNYASITSAKFSGGIVGRIKNVNMANNGTVKYCYNYGIISNGKNDYPRAGGITAESYGTIQLCVNYGNVTSTTTPEGNGDVRAGGIVAYTEKAIDQCANYGNIKAGTSFTETSYAGGITGYSTSNITNCYNTGDITAKAKNQNENIEPTYTSDDFSKKAVHTHEEWYVFDTSKQTLEYERKLNTPTITSKELAYAGGITAYCFNSIENCYNTGDVSGGKYQLHFDFYEYVMMDYKPAYSSDIESDGASGNYILDIYQYVYYQPICPTNAKISNAYYTNAQSFYTGYILFSDKAVRTMWLGVSGAWSQGQIGIIYSFLDGGNMAGCVKDIVGKEELETFSYYKNTDYSNRANAHKLIRQLEVKQNGNQFTLIYSTIPSGCWHEDTAITELQGSVGLEYTLDYTSTDYNNLAFSMVGTASSSISEQDCFTDIDGLWAVSSNINDGYPYLKNLYW